MIFSLIVFFIDFFLVICLFFRESRSDTYTIVKSYNTEKSIQSEEVFFLLSNGIARIIHRSLVPVFTIQNTLIPFNISNIEEVSYEVIKNFKRGKPYEIPEYKRKILTPDDNIQEQIYKMVLYIVE